MRGYAQMVTQFHTLLHFVTQNPTLCAAGPWVLAGFSTVNHTFLHLLSLELPQALCIHYMHSMTTSPTAIPTANAHIASHVNASV
jgi:hypothetical protein